MTREAETLQDRYRRLLRQFIGQCPTCGQNTLTLRDTSSLLGLGKGGATLHRFLSGKNADGYTLDKIHAFLAAKELL